VDLAAGPTGCGDLARGGCSFACNFNATRSTVFTEAERRTRPNRRCRCINDSHLAYRLKIPPGKSCSLLYNNRQPANLKGR